MNSAERWPLHPPPRRGERLTSWLYRIAAAHHLTLGELLEHDLGHRPDTTGILDVDPPAQLITTITRRSGLDHNRVRRMSVSGHVPWLLDSHDPHGNDFNVYVRQLSILLPTSRRGSGGRRRPGPGWRPWLPTTPAATRACPDCADDPHRQGFTLASGLPLQLSCPTHRCYLEPCFGYPDHLYWDTAEPLPRPAPPEVTTLDGYTEQALNGGAVSLPRRTVHSGMWFRLLRTLLDELCAPIDRTGPVVREIWTRRGGRPPRLIYRPFEALRRPDQVDLLIVAADAVARLGAGEITPHGEHGHLFIPEPVGADYAPGRRHPPPGTESPLRAPTLADGGPSDQAARLSAALAGAIEAARRDPASARSMFDFMRQGCHTEQALERLLGTFNDLGISTCGFMAAARLSGQRGSVQASRRGVPDDDRIVSGRRRVGGSPRT